MDQQRFLQQLQIVLDPSKGDVKAATNVLQNDFYKQPQALLFLVQIIISHDDPALKQLAATQARPLVPKSWPKLPTQQTSSARSQLFQATLSESSNLVRHSASRLISAIAKIDLEGKWPELPRLLQQAATSSRHEERAVGVYLLYSILETMGDGFSSKYQELFALFSNTIKDPESLEVKINTLLALSKMAITIDAEEDQESVREFQDLFPAMVAVLKDAIDSKNEEYTMLTFEVFNTLLTAEYQLMSKHFQDLVIFMNELATKQSVDDETRTQAINYLMQCVMFRRLRVQGARMGEPLTKSMMQVATETEDDDDDDELTPAKSALHLIESMAQTLPSNQVVVPILELLPQYAKHSEASYRAAGILSLGRVIEGAPDFVSTQLGQVMPIVYDLLGDHEPSVRRAALQTTALLADSLPEDVTKDHEKLMPLLLKNLTAAMSASTGEEDDPALSSMKSATAAIDATVDGMDADDAVKYLQQLAPLLQRLFQHPDPKIKALAAGALGSLASTVEAPFLPYLKDSMDAMQSYITKKESEEELELRACCTDAMGLMAIAVGPAEFRDYVQPLMHTSEEALNLDDSSLKQSTYMLWASLAKVYKEDFAPFLDGVVDALFVCLDQEEGDLEVELGDSAKDLLGKEVVIAGRKVKVAAVDSDDEDGDIEDVDLDDEDDDSEWGDFNTVTPIASEKETALESLADILVFTKTAYIPYFEKTIEKILPFSKHSYELVRQATLSTLHRAYAALYQLLEESGRIEKWKPGIPLQVEVTPELKKVGQVTMNATIEVWGEEEETAVVIGISQALSENLNLTGPNLLSYDDVLTQVVQTVTNIITKKHTCQLGFDDALEDVSGEDMETTELDWLVVDSAMEVISGMAAALGPSFAELWKIFSKPVMRYASGGESLGRASACGVISEIIIGMDQAITPYTNQILPILLRRMSDEDAQTKSNATYAVGRLVEKSHDQATITKAYPTILQKLESVFSTPTHRCRDNATGCLSRLILAHKDRVPVAEVLPALVNSGMLPLKDDYLENEPLWKMIITLYKQQDPTIQQLTPKLAPIMLSVLGEPEDQLTDAVRVELTSLVEHLKSIH